MLWFGLLLVVIAAVLFFFSKRFEAKVHHVKATETTKVGAVTQLVSEVAADMPDGVALGFKDYVELKGRIACDEPIRGELSNQLGAIVETEVVRVFERRDDTRDPHGNVRTEWRRTEEKVSSNRREARFWIDDGSGRLLVQPNLREVELVKTFERFEQPQGGPGGGFGGPGGGFGSKLSVGTGGFQVSLDTGHWDMNAQRPLGFKFVERMLPVDKAVYALGEAAVTEDRGLVFRAPSDADKKKPFMLSQRTEEELVTSATKSANILKYIGIGLAVGGAVLVVVGLFR